MKIVFSLFLVLAAIALLANSAFAGEKHLSREASAELYPLLNLPETPVADEHGGPEYAKAKYGQRLGCVKWNSSARVECWIRD